jgi:hypothetical protein
VTSAADGGDGHDPVKDDGGQAQGREDPERPCRHVAAYDALRSGALRDLSGRPELGIISFPSFHAASAVSIT